jgi:hypothetical protein
MTESSSKQPDEPIDKSENSTKTDEIRWKIHPAGENPGKAVLAIAVILFFLAVIKIVCVEWIYVIISAVVLILSLARFFFPVSFILNNNGIRTTFLGYSRLRQWHEFRRIIEGPKGIHLSPFKKAHILEATRGCYIICPYNKDKVLEYIKAMIE